MQAVVSNASVWDTLKLLPPDHVPEQWRRERAATPPCPSFMHLHVGFDAAGAAMCGQEHVHQGACGAGAGLHQGVHVHVHVQGP